MAWIVRCIIAESRRGVEWLFEGAGGSISPGALISIQDTGTFHATQKLHPAAGVVGRARDGRPHRRLAGICRRHDQGRRAAFAVGNDGDQRDGAEGRRADDDRRDQREGRRARQEARARRRRSGVELAAVRRKGAAAHLAGQGRRGVRLLDLGVAQVGAAGVRGAERPPLLPGAVRRRGAVEERVLHGRRAQPAGDSGRRVPDEQGRRRRQALGAARHRLRVSAHDEQDPARVPEVEGRRRQGHRREVHAVRPQRLPDDRRRHQEVRGRRQDGGGLDDQRRLERAVLQGARQPGPQGDRRSGRRVLGG